MAFARARLCGCMLPAGWPIASLQHSVRIVCQLRYPHVACKTLTSQWQPPVSSCQHHLITRGTCCAAHMAAPQQETITSTSNNLVKHCVKLRTAAKYRHEVRQFMLCGLDLLQEAAGGGPTGRLQTKVLFIPQQQQPESVTVPPWLSTDRLIQVTEAVMKKLTGLENVDGMQAVALLDIPPFMDLNTWISAPSESTTRDAPKQQESRQQQKGSAGENTQQVTSSLQRVLALDAVQDPGNMGTLLRSALAFGFDAVYLLPGCCDPFNEKAVRASRGAALRMPVASGSLDELTQVCHQRGLLMIAAEPESEHEQQQQQQQQFKNLQQGSPAVCLVLGSEGRGLCPDVLSKCQAVAIPMVGQMESLNVGVAGSILMFMLSQGGVMQLTGRLSQLGLLSMADRKL